jgi:hypothetical protein
MNQLPFIVAAYALFAAATLWLSVDAVTRTARARRKLRAVDPRAERDMAA